MEDFNQGHCFCSQSCSSCLGAVVMPNSQCGVTGLSGLPYVNSSTCAPCLRVNVCPIFSAPGCMCEKERFKHLRHGKQPVLPSALPKPTYTCDLKVKLKISSTNHTQHLLSLGMDLRCGQGSQPSFYILEFPGVVQEKRIPQRPFRGSVVLST